MSDKMKYVKIKRENGTYTDAIPVAVDAANVQFPDGRTLIQATQDFINGTDIAVKFNSTEVYNPGDYIYNNQNLYRVLVKHNANVSWDNWYSVTNAQQIVLTDEIKNMIYIGTSQPSDPANKVWINSGLTSTIQIPTELEFENLRDSVAEQYSAKTYSKGEYCINDNKLYRCKADIATAEATFVPSHWQLINVGDEIYDLKDDLSENKTLLASGDVNLIWGASYYDGYYTAQGYTGTKAEGKTTQWGVVVIHVKAGDTIVVSNMANGGVNSAWLNSSDPNDINSLFNAAYNDGTKVCPTDYLALSVYNSNANYKDYLVAYNSGSMLENKIQAVDLKFSNRFTVIDRDDYAITDNMYSNKASDYLSGTYPGAAATYAVYVNQQYPAEDKTVYIYSECDTAYSAFQVILYVFNSNDEYLGYLNFAVNAIRNTNVMARYPTASYFYVCLSSSNGSVPVSPNDAVVNFKVYVGYKNVNSSELYYPRYISKYAESLFDKTGYTLDGETGLYTNSSNLYSNDPNDWNYPSYNSSMKEEPEIVHTDFGYIAFFDPNSVPEVLSQGSLAVQLLDSSNAVVITNYVYLSSGNVVVRDLTVPNEATHAKIYFNTGNASIKVGADDIRKLRIYVGPKDYTSSMRTPLVPYPNTYPSKAIPVQSRTVMDGGYLPDYWLYYLYEKKDVLDNLNDTIGSDGISFAFITDQHWPSNYQKSPKILRWLKEHTAIDRIIAGGDLINEHNSLATAMMFVKSWRDQTNGMYVRNVRGNHDNNSMQNNASYFLGNGRFYSNLVRPAEEKIIVNDGNLYFYEKIESQKIIIFYLDTGDMVTPSLIDFDAQITWMGNIVSSLTSDWSILVVQHVVYDGGTQESPTLYSTGEKTVNFLNSVTNCDVIGLIGGHTHYDYSDTSNGWPIIITNTDSSQRAQSLPATEGTISEQLLDIFHIDTHNHKIYATRIGAGEDREWNY